MAGFKHTVALCMAGVRSDRLKLYRHSESAGFGLTFSSVCYWIVLVSD